ncbi:VCBS repeat-containing protein [Balneolaceae bacterium YR4-1]|uniref:VCBS repeat-containing protein n=1 Tax=Halalkalibaculum roseum TaxID=2709311 RepID=A0A6M1SUY8_9BACT|nr:VCBS repeat-containing protein [Halalkalibaculum roseum]NGP76622.1 VCBS repeat-containing protein [Halalkalibaculum roseum]
MHFKNHLKNYNSIPFGSLFFAILFAMTFISCSGSQDTRFSLLESEETGVSFANNLENTPEFNILNYLYFYDGGGVSIGDINNDGLPDIYFTANMQENRLYLNKGDFNFEDITDKAQVAGSADWTTGTTMADVNGDGLLDIYVSSVNFLNKSGRNQLFINNGDSTFSDKAAEYGLDFQGFAKQASFFDYDNDGDLDMYLLNHSVHSEGSFTKAEKRTTYSEESGDKLYQNNEGIFTDVTKQAGIYSSMIGYGLAATVSDVNNDGCQDIYVSNDFHENDYLYLNNCDGTFREVIDKTTGHNSRASMGADIADFNNDGLADIFVLDMLPYDETTRKSAVSSEPYNAYKIQRQFGYHPQLIRNTLQLNRGIDDEGNPLFSEIAQLAGVNATDWSWASLFFDMDNDGNKDLFVSNGIYRRPNDLDYLAVARSEQAQQVMSRGMSDTTMSLIQRMPKVEIPNFAFINEGDYRFTNRSETGFNRPSFSNGAAYGDLDNDGDLDLVVNNVNSEAFIYKNETREQEDRSYLKIKLAGNTENSFGIGARVNLFTDDSRQLYEMMPTRGFLSSVEPVLTIGLDTLQTIDSLTVQWPDGEKQTVNEVSVNQTLTLKQEDAENWEEPALGKVLDTPFRDVSDDYAPLFSHRENTYSDYDLQQMVPHMLSTQGPAMASGDVNGDGLDDFYVGGAKNQSGTLYIQSENGEFESASTSAFNSDRIYEDTDAAFFDANGDGAPDLYVVSGGNEFMAQSNSYQDRLYLNDGNGEFIKIEGALPPIRENGAVIAPADFDADGDIDLFLGNRSVPGSYGTIPRSYLFQNDGNGRFRDVTDVLSEGLVDAGMITDASWQDVNGDAIPDLVLSGTWMPISIFINSDGIIKNRTADYGLAESNGWWNTLEPGDFDGDGDIDFLAGNLGLNSYLKASREEPLKLYVKDFNEDGQLDPVLAYTESGKEYPAHPRDELLTNFKYLRSEFRTYGDFAGKSMQQIFGEQLEDSISIKYINQLSSSYLENDGTGGFTLHELPVEAQFTPIFAIKSADFNDDGIPDALIGGNFFDVKPSLGGRYDAGYGLYLRGSGEGHFEAVDLLKSGFVLKGEVREIDLLRIAGGRRLIPVARNNDSLLLFEQRHDE